MPQIYQTTQIARPQFYDRNPVMSILSYNAGGVAPHAVTTRTSLTVPAAKKAWLDGLWLRITRQTAPAGAGLVQILCPYTPSGGGAAYMNWLEMSNGAAGFSTYKDVVQLGFLNSGDLLQIQTVDPSAGGTVDYTLACKSTTYDG